MENTNQQQNNNTSAKEIQEMLSQQTTIILSAVDEKISSLETKLAGTELRINQKIEKLTTTLDAFLNRLTMIEDEFEIMKAEINKMKEIIREKLNVEIQ